MKEEDLKAFTDSIKEKLGEENMAMISDDLGTLITHNSTAISESLEKDKTLKTLRENNERLVMANANLLQQIPAHPDYDTHQTKDEVEEKKSFSFRSVFDDKGNFKK
mgnify:FL=1